MKKQKLLSVSMVFVLVCALLAGMLTVAAETVETVTWRVTGTENAEAGKYETLQSAIEAAEKTEWQANHALVIEIEAEADQSLAVKDGVLFGVDTIATAGGNKLPIFVLILSVS